MADPFLNRISILVPGSGKAYHTPILDPPKRSFLSGTLLLPLRAGVDATCTIFLVMPSGLHRTMIPPQAFRIPALRKEREGDAAKSKEGTPARIR
jgi:hypothetical protein